MAAGRLVFVSRAACNRRRDRANVRTLRNFPQGRIAYHYANLRGTGRHEKRPPALQLRAVPGSAEDQSRGTIFTRSLSKPGPPLRVALFTVTTINSSMILPLMSGAAASHISASTP